MLFVISMQYTVKQNFNNLSQKVSTFNNFTEFEFIFKISLQSPAIDSTESL